MGFPAFRHRNLHPRDQGPDGGVSTRPASPARATWASRQKRSRPISPVPSAAKRRCAPTSFWACPRATCAIADIEESLRSLFRTQAECRQRMAALRRPQDGDPERRLVVLFAGKDARHAARGQPARLDARDPRRAGSSGEARTSSSMLTTLEAATKERPLAGRRFSFEHGPGLIRPVDIRRVKALGLRHRPQPAALYFAAARSLKHAAGHGQEDREAQHRRSVGADCHGLGPARCAAWIDAGMLVTGGTDCPASHYDPEQPAARPSARHHTRNAGRHADA